jgi:hypothetical protein
MIRPVIIMTVCAALSGCGTVGGFSGFSGIGSKSAGKRAASENELPYKAKVTKSENDILDFSVSVANNGEGVEAVRESVRFEGTKYCLFTNGSSDINWTIDEATSDWAFVQDGDALIFNGRCVGR